MKKFSLILSLLFLSVILTACGNNEESNNDIEQSSDTNKQDEDNNQREERQSTEQSEVKTDQSLHKDSSAENDKGKDPTSKNDNASKMKNNDNSKSYLNGLSASKIEYARIWHQLGMVKDVKNIYVKKYPKGTPVNKNAEKSAMYPEDVVKLEAPMKVGGSITYSSNGDGTINVYEKIPYRWESSASSNPEDIYQVTKNAVEQDIETVEINATDNAQIKRLAQSIQLVND
ncbi:MULTISPECIES: hypothetical protein [Staphylococcus]|uniref:Lipoprotein n=1 Tax=Staphylococcus cohnii TaxID=29382 RepID=A0A2T4LQJ3_9STAP|nr:MULTISPECIES: hypothetical protein [Staphylococcus]HLQ82827.1 hypothetical protein [Pseudogracilibacillus sp.]MBA1353000.1 hypothetical protein [Staphylococcus cohnii]MBA1390595.1 hypothetical protein [Staphylococcus cohnii]MBZ8172694.1 hypothetical protein [Staphylococcus cohnii]MCE5033519.1 hypothetical protein [Staphylococcus cohnii]